MLHRGVSRGRSLRDKTSLLLCEGLASSHSLSSLSSLPSHAYSNNEYCIWIQLCLFLFKLTLLLLIIWTWSHSFCRLYGFCCHGKFHQGLPIAIFNCQLNQIAHQDERGFTGNETDRRNENGTFFIHSSSTYWKGCGGGLQLIIIPLILKLFLLFFFWSLFALL